ncbi:hypothetical protein BC936DRAFT_149237 [Jimgerdemannia flammicorona]|uniref:Uncharacterized protein n=2 Tax=Jimgerdemannia flammicorona TaxID=994334 RepID=A0A433D185_9FUNG|nr:hypothetical protein BC936DRAFT_149237 [Jimgerdemannia flammicorona]RUS32214.1 hypothetical protein BC938DRAFT_476024 [Jimgerdemannia flammicorona]
MVTFYEEISQSHQEWIKQQKLFFVATAPLTGKGHVNVSPKGYDAFRILSSRQVCYLDLTGSGVETISHVKENGRLTFMFSAFDGPPRIIRLWTTAVVHERGSPEYEALAEREFPELRGHKSPRSVIVGDVHRVGQSCGFGVPLYEFKEQRSTLLDWAKNTCMEDYWVDKNSFSLDGLPGKGAAASSSYATWWRQSVPFVTGFAAGMAVAVAAVKVVGARR